MTRFLTVQMLSNVGMPKALLWMDVMLRESQVVSMVANHRPGYIVQT
jgi:hypothetical protein